MMKRTILLLVIATAICITGCKKENPAPNVFTNDKHTIDTSHHAPVDTTHHTDTIPVDTIPVSTCDTVGVTYTDNIRIIIAQNCTSCHNGSYSGGDDDDDDVPDLRTYTQLTDAIRDKGTNKFLRMINHTGGDDYMPPSYLLDACQRRQIELWVAAGMPQ